MLDVLVCRSNLDPTVWFIYASQLGEQDGGLDLTDFEHPGRLRAVQRYAADRYAPGRPVRWQRVDGDTYEMKLS